MDADMACELLLHDVTTQKESVSNLFHLNRWIKRLVVQVRSGGGCEIGGHCAFCSFVELSSQMPDEVIHKLLGLVLKRFHYVLDPRCENVAW
jgi:hypothetical protein